MKKFLLIIAVATAGFIPQLALCENLADEGLVDSARALEFFNTKQAFPYANPIEINPALKADEITGQSRRLSLKTLDCGQKALVDQSGNVVKVLPGDDTSGIAN